MTVSKSAFLINCTMMGMQWKGIPASTTGSKLHLYYSADIIPKFKINIHRLCESLRQLDLECLVCLLISYVNAV